MNVTLKINDQLAKDARHQAVDEGLSLSGWLARLVRRELAKPAGGKGGGTLLEALGCDDLADMELDFPRDQSGCREVDFS